MARGKQILIIGKAEVCELTAGQNCRESYCVLSAWTRDHSKRRDHVTQNDRSPIKTISARL